MRFLIIKISSLGDIVQSFGLLAYLKNKFPSASIDWVVEKRCAELLKRHPFVDQVIEIDSKNRNPSAVWQSIKQLRVNYYDIVFDVQGNIKSGLVLFFTRAKEKVGFKKVSEWPNLLFTSKKITLKKDCSIRQDYLNLARVYFNDSEDGLNFTNPLLKIDEEEKTFIESVLSKCQNKKKIIISPGSTWDNKCLDRGRLSAFLKSFNNSAYFILTHGSASEERDCLYLHEHFKDSSLILKKSSLALLQNLMSQVDLVISVDSLPLHIAESAHVKTLSFFGPSSMKKYAPEGPLHRSFQGSCPLGVTFDKRCPKLRTCDSGDCIKSMNPLELVKTQIVP
jgi:heptosyltransferase-1